MKAIIKSIEKEVRASRIYYDWKQNNKSTLCSLCQSEDNLELHHITPLYTIIKDLYNYHQQDKKQTLNHSLEIHKNNIVLSATLCETCHDNQHKHRPSKTKPSKKFTPPGPWCVAPRDIEKHFVIKKSSNALNLIPFQVLLVLGYYILNGQINDTIIIFNPLEMANLMGKKIPSRWKSTIERALENLKSINIISNYTIISTKRFKVSMNKHYLKRLANKSWFFLLSDVASSSMLELGLKWYLSTVKNHYKTYKIRVKLLKQHIGITDKQEKRIIKHIQKACNSIKWVKKTTGTLTIKKENQMIFKLTSRPIPTNDLRNSIKHNLKNHYA